jgi:RNA polymerase sigma factor (sigma-70 family)
MKQVCKARQKMIDTGQTTLLMRGWIERLKKGDAAARRQLLDCSCHRLLQLTRKMLRRFPRVKRWEETDDVLQNVTMRLYRALSQVTPATVRDYLKLASVQIRRELLDLVRHYYGPLGPGTKHSTQHDDPNHSTHDNIELQPADFAQEPSRLAAWTEFHAKVDELPDDEREVFDLLWYQGLSQVEAAQLLNVTTRTIQRRWQSARLNLYERLHGELPPEE